MTEGGHKRPLCVVRSGMAVLKMLGMLEMHANQGDPTDSSRTAEKNSEWRSAIRPRQRRSDHLQLRLYIIKAWNVFWSWMDTHIRGKEKEGRSRPVTPLCSTTLRRNLALPLRTEKSTAVSKAVLTQCKSHSCENSHCSRHVSLASSQTWVTNNSLQCLSGGEDGRGVVCLFCFGLLICRYALL